MIDDKLKTFNPAEPYVWRLHLTEVEFCELERRVQSALASHIDLTGKDWAVQTLVYLSEWYHRRYSGGASNPLPNFTNRDWQALWNNAGIRSDIYVYKDSQGNSRWLYSTYVLGGLAIRHELGRNDHERFLKGLCRLYHGEDYTLENLDEAARAISFRESIKQKHSLYYYLQALLNGDMDAQANEDADFGLLLTTLRHADDEVLRQKFRLEWVITYRESVKAMRRMLRLWLKPEEVGGGLNQYLRYERVRLWGIDNPGQVRSIMIGIRFVNHNNVVKDADWNHPVVVYCNTGQADTGFVTWGVEQYAVCKDIPTESFTSIQIIARTENNKELVAQEIATTEWMQLWRTNDYGSEWSSRQQAQHATAIVASPRCHIDATYSPISLPFAGVRGALSAPWQWAFIYDSLTFNDETGKALTIYNRNGYDQVTTRRYNNLLSYRMGGFIRHEYIADSDMSDEPDEELLPLIFSKDDVLVRHFQTKDAIINAEAEEEESAEIVEWKQANGHYAVWNGNNLPPYGVVTLRINIKDVYYPLRAAFLPSISQDMPLERDVEKQSIEFIDIDGNHQQVDDDPTQGNLPQTPTLEISIGTVANRFILEVWRPFRLKEVCMDGHVRCHPDESFVLPYILRGEVTYNEFDEDGYVSYDCSRLGSIYNLSGTGIGAAMKAWQDGTSWKASQLDPEAPKSLRVGFGKSSYEGNEEVTFYRWNYYADSMPEEESYDALPIKNTILFQSLKEIDAQLDNVYPVIKWMPFGFDRKKVSLVKCFEIAVEHRLYFFMLKPLADLHSFEDYRLKLLNPLIKAHGGMLTEKDKRELARLLQELGVQPNL